MNGLILYRFIQTTYDQLRLQTLIDTFSMRSIKVVTVSTDQVIRLLETTTARFFKFAYFFEEDRQLAQTLESRYGIRVFNQENPINLAHDRALLAIALRNENLPTPQTILLPYVMNQSILLQYQEVRAMLHHLPFPYLIKERYVEPNQAVYFIRSEQDLYVTCQQIGMKPLLAQEYIGQDARKIMKIFVLGSRVRASIDVIEKQGKTLLKPTRIHRRVEKIALATARAIGADHVLIHCLVINQTIPYIYGIKTNPDLYELESLTRNPLHDELVHYIVKASQR